MSGPRSYNQALSGEWPNGELDLDKVWREHESGYARLNELDKYLVQRLRETEAEVETCHAAGEMQYEIEHNARIHAEERIAALESALKDIVAMTNDRFARDVAEAALAPVPK